MTPSLSAVYAVVAKGMGVRACGLQDTRNLSSASARRCNANGRSLQNRGVRSLLCCGLHTLKSLPGFCHLPVTEPGSEKPERATWVRFRGRFLRYFEISGRDNYRGRREGRSRSFSLYTACTYAIALAIRTILRRLWARNVRTGFHLEVPGG